MDPIARSLSTPVLLRAPWLVPCLVLAVGLGVTYGLRHVVRDNNRAEAAAHFQARVDGLVGDIGARLRSYEQVLRGARALVAASDEVRPDEFHEYASQMRLADRYPGLRALGYSIVLAPDAPRAHEGAAGAQGFTSYAVHPAGGRESHSTVLYLEPLDEATRGILGLDMLADPRLRPAMERARDEGRLAGTRRVAGIAQVVGTGADPEPGFLWYLPVYTPFHGHAAPDRKRDFQGWIHAILRMPGLMRGIPERQFGESGVPLAFRIYDGDTSDSQALLYDSLADEGRAGTPARTPAFQADARVDVVGRPWMITVRSTPEFEARLGGSAARLITLAGIAASLLAATIAWLLVTGRERAYRKARELAGQYQAEEFRTRRLNRALKLLSACNVAMIRARDERRLLGDICRLLVRQGDYGLAWVGYAQAGEAAGVRPMAQEGLEDEGAGPAGIPWADMSASQGPCGAAIRDRRTVLIQDHRPGSGPEPWEPFARGRGFGSGIALPLLGQAGVLGALAIYSSQPRAFNEEEVRLLQDLAADLAFGIETLRTRAKHDTAVERLTFLAYHDPLTHLPNRLQLAKRFEQATQAARARHTMVGLMFLGMDNFKQVNDMLGHERGDQLMIRAIERLRQCADGIGTIGRHGGDQFVALLEGVRGRGQIEARAQGIIDAFGEPFQFDGHAVPISFSIGISVFPEDGEIFDLLLKKADTAMHHAKDKGRNTFQFSTAGTDEHSLEQMRLQGLLSHALDNGELSLHYQPQVDIRHGGLFGFEALLRWNHPELGAIPPVKFIPLAERSGLIVPIGEWVLKEACRQAGAWLALGHPVRMAVNLSVLQLRRGNLLDSVEAALAESGLPAHLLDLELTESMLLRDMDTVEDTLQRLKRMGVKLSIDDFGTGYSSLSYLKRLAVDKVKIDQSFVADLLTNAESAAIVRAIIQLAQALQLDVIAEGAENAEQVRRLSLYGCMRLQGYHFSRPVSAEAAALLLTRNFLQPPAGGAASRARPQEWPDGAVPGAARP